jgi:hypothetical protein
MIVLVFREPIENVSPNAGLHLRGVKMPSFNFLTDSMPFSIETSCDSIILITIPDAKDKEHSKSLKNILPGLYGLSDQFFNYDEVWFSWLASSSYISKKGSSLENQKQIDEANAV